jgi:glycosyltransferase involved in cell wall biosynthesis
VILYQDDDLETHALLNALEDVNIVTIKVKESEQLSLGAKRNLSIEKSRGDYFCTWDDDDWYHNERINLQISSIKENCKPVSVLIYILLYDSLNNQSYLSFAWPWENTVLCDKTLFRKHKYHPHWNKKEDSYFLNELLTINAVCPLIKPSLYIYTYNGNNTWGYNHFQRLFSNSQKLLPQSDQMIKGVLAGDYTPQQSSSLLLSQDVLEQMDYLTWAKSTMQNNIAKSMV